MLAVARLRPVDLESVFHDVPVSGVLSRIAPARELLLIALHGYGLKRLGVTHGELIEARTLGSATES